jgi:aryl-alcohol dehydrogenase-like predicted oxidoreductase
METALATGIDLFDSATGYTHGAFESMVVRF